MDTIVFAPSNTGTKAHAFLGSRGAKEGNLRAACRVTIQRSVSATFISLDRARKFYSVCDTCVKLYLAAMDRLAASLSPVTESHDLGYVAPGEHVAAEALQPAEVREIREAAEDAARDARRDEALDSAFAKLAAPAAPVLRCEICKSTGADVEKVLDPYTTALYPEDTDHDLMTLCGPCQTDRFEDN